MDLLHHLPCTLYRFRRAIPCRRYLIQEKFSIRTRKAPYRSEPGFRAPTSTEFASSAASEHHNHCICKAGNSTSFFKGSSLSSPKLNRDSKSPIVPTKRTTSFEGSLSCPEISEQAKIEEMNSHKRLLDSTPGNAETKKEKKPKEKYYPPEAILRRDLNMCSKEANVLRALELYDQTMAEQVVKFNQYNFNILLYLCSTAAMGTLAPGKSGSLAQPERLNLHANGNGDCFNDIPPDSVDKEALGAAGADEGSGTVATGDGTLETIVWSSEVKDLCLKRGFEIYERMLKDLVPPNEATLTAVARLAVAKGDGELAFQMVKEMAALEIAPKLRSYSPALFTFCQNKDVNKALEVDAHMVSAGVQPEEPELGALLQLSVDLGLEEKVYSLLHRLRARVRGLSPPTIEAIEQWFSGRAGAAAGRKFWGNDPSVDCIRQAMEAGGGGWHGLGWMGKGGWKVDWTQIDKQGVCCTCGEKLATIDIDPIETENFALSVAELACKRETKSNDFRYFQDWLDKNGPFDMIVDGANVGLYNQNFLQGGFNFFQLNAVVNGLQQHGISKRPPLVILHQARTKFGTATSPFAQQLFQKWRSTGSFYTTPTGSNDDWYWLYAAVKSKCLLLTNDEMRDHLFQLLGNDFFPRWKERHQVRLACTTLGPEYHLPPPYSIVVQESEKGWWHIPKSRSDDMTLPQEWLCVKRPGNLLLEEFQDIVVARKEIEMSNPSSKAEPSVEETAVATSKEEEPKVAPKKVRRRSPSLLKKMKAAEKKSNGEVLLFDI